MSLTADPDLDIEALFEAELAGLADESLNVTSDKCLDAFGLRVLQAGDTLALDASVDPLAAHDDDDDDDDQSDEEPDSFQLLRAAFQRRERALDEFGRNLELVQQEFAGASTQANGASAQFADAPPSSSITLGVTAATVSTSPAIAGDSQEPGAGGDFVGNAAPGQDTANCVLAAPECEHGTDTPAAIAAAQDANEAAQDESAPAGGSGAQVETAASGEAVPAEEPSCGLRGREVEEQRRQALLALDAELAATMADREAQLAEAAAERERLAAEREATRQRLEAAAREAAERAAAREAVVEALRRETLELACRQMAAWRIGRAWRRHREVQQRACRERAVVVLQAAWRAAAGRRRAAELRRRREAMRLLEDAARRGRIEELKAAMDRAKALGLADVAQTRVAELESAGRAAAQLSAAASSGSLQDFRAALAAARAFPHLADTAADSCAAFEQRQKAAEAAVWQAAEGEPMSAFIRLLDAASALGVDPQGCKAALEAVRQRDARLASQLAWAAAAQGAAFNAAAFEALVKRATALGLKGDVAAARHAVDRRRRAATADLRERSTSASATELEAMAGEARRLGMETEAQKLEQLRLQRQQSMEAELQRAAAQASAPRFIALVRCAAHCGVQPDVLQAAGAALAAHQTARWRELEAAAAAAALPTFLAARGGAVVCGLGLAQLLAADRAMQGRRRVTAAGLLDVVRQLTGAGSLTARPGAVLRLVGEVGRALGLGAPAAVLERAAGRLLQAPDGSAGGGARAARAVASRLASLVDKGYAHGERPVGSGGGGDGGGSGSDGVIPAETREALRERCASAVQLGLHDTAVLALCALDVHAAAALAQGLVALRDVVVPRDYWGLPLRPLPHCSAGTPSARGPTSPAAAAEDAAAPHAGQPDGDGHLTARLLQRMSRGGAAGHVATWSRQLTLADLAALLSPPPPQPATRLAVAPPSSPGAARSRPSAAAAPQPPPPKPSQRSRPLNREILQRNAPAAAPSPVATTPGPGTSAPGVLGGPAALHRVSRLDLGLERLSSLAGLDALFPALRVLHASNNELTSLEGLRGLVRLRELWLRDNLLTDLGPQLQRALPGARPAGAGSGDAALLAGTALRRLALDSNRLAGQLSGLAQCSGLRALSLAQNALTDASAAGLECCASGLTNLVLRSNCLAGPLSGVMPAPALTALRELDVSSNRLTSLSGIENLLLLQSLTASSNELTELPRPLYLPYLTSLDLSNNALTAFPGCGRDGGNSRGVLPLSAPPVVLPSLRSLVLTENRISQLGPMGPMPSLTSLDLSFNQLTSLGFLDALAGLSGMLHLHIGDNPVTRPPDVAPQLRLAPSCSHRRRVLVRLPSLRSLDHEDISDDERARSAVYGAQCTAPTAAVMMRALRAGGTCGGLLAVHVHSRKGAAGGDSPAACTTVSCGGGGGGSGAGKRRSREAGAAASARPPLCYTSVCAGAVRGCDPTAVARLLAAAARASLSSSLSSSLVGRSIGASRLRSMTEGEAVGAASTAAAPQLPHHHHHHHQQQQQRQQPGTPTAWATQVDRLWAAALPYDLAADQQRQLELGQRLGAELRDSPALAAGRPRTPSASHMLSHSPMGPASADGAAPAGRAGTLDAPLARGLQPVARALHALAATCRSAPVGAAAAAGRSGGPSVQQPAGLQVSGKGHGAAQPQAEAVAVEAEARYEVALLDMGRRLADETRGLLSRLSNASKLLLEGANDAADDVLRALAPQPVPQPSFLLCRLAVDADAAATRLQAWWRGVQSRRVAAGLRSGAHQAARHAAAALVQAWWRGHRVRCGGQLAALRNEARAARQARELEESRRREAAAIKIQAYYRGHRVRVRLRAALASARAAVWGSAASLADLDRDLDLELQGSGELEDVMAFLRPLEDIFAEEEKQEAEARQRQQEALLPLVVPPHSRGLQPSAGRVFSGPAPGAGIVGLRGPVGFAAGSGALPGSPLAALQLPLQSPLAAATAAGGAHFPAPAPASAGSLPPLLMPSPQNMWAVPTRGSAASPQPPSSAPDGLAGPVQGPGAGPGPGVGGVAGRPQDMVGPSPGMGGMRGRPALQVDPEADSAWGEGGDGEAARTPSSAASPGRSPSEARRGQRHLERLQALAAEWGFKDLATAEAFYRRTLRQKQGQTRRKLQEKYRDPAQRLQKLQQAVQSHVGRGASHGPPAHGPPAHGPPAHGPPAHGPPARSPQVPGSAPGPGGPQPRGPGGALWPTPAGGGQRVGPCRPSVAGSEGACASTRPGRALSSADSVLASGRNGCSGGAVPSGGLPLIHRSNSHSSGSPSHPRPAVRKSGGGGGAVSETLQVHSHVLPPLANNWMHSPSQTPPGSGGSGPAALRGPLQVTAAPAAVRWRGQQP